MMRYDSKVAAKIFKETFKRARFLHGDKSAVLVTLEGLNFQMLETNNEAGSKV